MMYRNDEELSRLEDRKESMLEVADARGIDELVE
jgi:hypothetical protein